MGSVGQITSAVERQTRVALRVWGPMVNELRCLIDDQVRAVTMTATDDAAWYAILEMLDE